MALAQLETLVDLATVLEDDVLPVIDTRWDSHEEAETDDDTDLDDINVIVTAALRDPDTELLPLRLTPVVDDEETVFELVPVLDGQLELVILACDDCETVAEVDIDKLIRGEVDADGLLELIYEKIDISASVDVTVTDGEVLNDILFIDETLASGESVTNKDFE